MDSEISIINTGDGSHTLLNRQMDETYHSRHGALRESRHVFIKMGLNHWIESHPAADRISIFEMGLGTGLNLILTLETALQKPEIHFYYTSLEAYPLNWDLLSQLNYPELISHEQLHSLYRQIHEAPWDKWVNLLPNFLLKKQAVRLEDFRSEADHFDLVYYDAFAPNKQPELWTAEVMSKVKDLMKTGGILVTYSAKGQLKRDLKKLGLNVETLPGPPGKAEMVRALK
ncbi:MAG: tRNA (5-methylaminomethyl-2-thiouridine)(34)-methyltransferase MnmD [Cyclobacteriaceae bacterium]